MLRISNRAAAEAVIGAGWRVLDVGNPFRLATTLVDRLPRVHTSPGRRVTQNAQEKVVRDHRPLVVGDIEALPFGDQAFDFVYASHVVEHVEKPAAALSELQRVARWGYIECPRGWYEFVDGSPFHRWHVDISGGELIFRPKTEEETRFIESRRLYDWDNRLFEQFYGCVFHQATSLDPFGTSLEKSICHVCVLWEGEIPFRIVPASSYA